MSRFYSLILNGCLISFTACTAMPQFFDNAEKILTDDCITIKVDKDAFQKDTDVKITVDVLNKESVLP